MKMELIRDKTIEHDGVTLYRMYWPDRKEEGGWAADSFVWHASSTAIVRGDAKLIGGTICGGTIEGGTIWGGTIWGGEHSCSPAMAQRSDGYCFVVHPVDGELRVWAACCDFGWDKAQEHWGESHAHHAETMRILNFLRAQVEAREVI